MLLKQQTFASANEAQARVRQIEQATGINRVQAIQDMYDQDVHPQQNAGIMRGQAQIIWDGLINAAFTRDRAPASSSPDGRTH